jgi:hypothetical protein
MHISTFWEQSIKDYFAFEYKKPLKHQPLLQQEETATKPKTKRGKRMKKKK